LEFAHYHATIEGEGLTELLAQLSSKPVRAIQAGRHAGCTVGRVQACDL
jgi:hypothetical protein